MPGRYNTVPFACYGLLQLLLVASLFVNFILSASIILSEDGQENRTQTEYLVLCTLVASSMLLLISILVIYILVYEARTVDLVGNLRIRKRTASFKVAIVSWILTSIETVLRLIAFFKFRDATLDYKSLAPWWSIVGYHVLLLIQTTFQTVGLYVYEKNIRLKREGADWLVTRKSFLILMVFINSYLWVLNVAKIQVLVDVTSNKMDDFFSGSVERIIYTLNRASTLAYHVESAQLFYRFYEEDDEDDQYEDLDNYSNYGNQIVETDSSKGVWLGAFLCGIFLSFAIGSFLVRSGIHEIHYAATFSTVGVMLTISCITMKTTMSNDNTDEDRPERLPSITDRFKDITTYMAGYQISHLRVLLFYSIGAASYHFLVTMRVILRGGNMDLYQPVREGCKGVACISLTIFMFWMSHEQRKLRCWRDLNVMFWTVIALLALDLVEETFEHGYTAKDSLQVYMLPLAIDFKTHVIIHTFSDLTMAKSEYRLELRNNQAGGAVPSNNTSRASTPLIINHQYI